jgi:hypothetical protein
VGCKQTPGVAPPGRNFRADHPRLRRRRGGAGRHVCLASGRIPAQHRSSSLRQALLEREQRMKKKLKKAMKKRLRKLVKQHGLEVATSLVTGFLGGLAASKE